MPDVRHCSENLPENDMPEIDNCLLFASVAVVSERAASTNGAHICRCTRLARVFISDRHEKVEPKTFNFTAATTNRHDPHHDHVVRNIARATLRVCL